MSLAINGLSSLCFILRLSFVVLSSVVIF